MIEVKRKEVEYFPASSDPCLKEGLGLLLDTSSKNLSVGLYKDGILHYVEEKDVLKKQSELLVPSIKALLEEGGFAPLDIAYVVVGKGPGSYTGVRVGLTVAKTVALALKCPLYCVSSLYLLKKGEEPTMVFVDARNSRSYVAVYQGDNCLLPDQAMENAEALKILKDHPDYRVGGEVGYLGLENPEDDVFHNLIDGVKKIYLTDPLSAKPSYLKEIYDVPHL